jgi:hypothetical protein
VAAYSEPGRAVGRDRKAGESALGVGTANSSKRPRQSNRSCSRRSPEPTVPVDAHRHVARRFRASASNAVFSAGRDPQELAGILSVAHAWPSDDTAMPKLGVHRRRRRERSEHVTREPPFLSAVTLTRLSGEPHIAVSATASRPSRATGVASAKDAMVPSVEAREIRCLGFGVPGVAGGVDGGPSA